MMAYTLSQGVRQDHRGKFYRNASYPNGKIIQVPYAETITRTIRMSFSNSDRAHLWEFKQNQRPTVTCCNREICFICGTADLSKHLFENGARMYRHLVRHGFYDVIREEQA